MARERFIFVEYPGKWIDQDISALTGEEIFLFDREFLGGLNAAIRKAKRVFRRNRSGDSLSEFRLFRITNGQRVPILMPTPVRVAHSPRRMGWDDSRLTFILN